MNELESIPSSKRKNKEYLSRENFFDLYVI